MYMYHLVLTNFYSHEARSEWSRVCPRPKYTTNFVWFSLRRILPTNSARMRLFLIVYREDENNYDRCLACRISLEFIQKYLWKLYEIFKCVLKASRYSEFSEYFILLIK